MQRIRNFRERSIYNIVSSLKYRKLTDDFQEEIKEDMSSINSSADVFIFAVETNNIYKAPPEQYKKTSEGKCNKDIQKVNKTYRKVNQFGSQKHS